MMGGKREGRFLRVGKECACNVGDPDSIPGLERSPGEGKGYPPPVFWPGEFHGVTNSWT